MKRPTKPPPRIAILQEEDGGIIDVISDDPAMKGAKVAIVRRAASSEWDVLRPSAVLVQFRHDEHENIAHLAELGFFETVQTDQSLIDGMRDIEGFNWNIRLLLDSAFRMEQVVIGCERYTEEHADPMAGVVGA
jgi:hypothetical protein